MASCLSCTKIFIVRRIVLLACCLFSLHLFAQVIPNGSFELADSAGQMLSWQVRSGQVTRSSAQFRAGVPFTATDENFFVSIEHDTLSSPVKAGRISNTFACTDTPLTLLFDAFYAPRFSNQHYLVEVLLTRWNAGHRDTVLYKRDSVAAVINSNNELVRGWTTQQLDLVPGFRNRVLPDTAGITITSDIPPIINTTVLLLDHFHFSSWRVGMHEPKDEAPRFTLFPNPATGSSIQLQCNETTPVLAGIYTMTGQLLHSHEITAQSAAAIDISMLGNGLYLMHLKTANGQQLIKFAVSR